MPGSTKKDEEEQPQLNFRRCREYGLGKLRDPVSITVHIYTNSTYIYEQSTNWV